MKLNKKNRNFKLILLVSLILVFIGFLVLISANLNADNDVSSEKSRAGDLEDGVGDILNDLSGIGVFTNGNDNAIRYIEATQPRLVVLYGGFDKATQIPDSTIIVGREPSFSDDIPDIEAIKNSLHGMPAKIGTFPEIDVWQGYNEILYNMVERGDKDLSVAYETLLEHDKTLLEKVAGSNNPRKVCIGNFKEGWPNLIDSNFRSSYVNPLNQYISENGFQDDVYLCVHEHESAETNSGNWVFGSSGYNGRFVDLVQSGLNYPVLVTVAGFDSAAGPETSHGEGWKDAGIPNGTYIDMLKSYNNAAISNGAEGIAVFQLGLGGQWDGYDVYDLLGNSGNNDGNGVGGDPGGNDEDDGSGNDNGSVNETDGIVYVCGDSNIDDLEPNWSENDISCNGCTLSGCGGSNVIVFKCDSQDEIGPTVNAFECQQNEVYSGPDTQNYSGWFKSDNNSSVIQMESYDSNDTRTDFVIWKGENFGTQSNNTGNGDQNNNTTDDGTGSDEASADAGVGSGAQSDDGQDDTGLIPIDLPPKPGGVKKKSDFDSSGKTDIRDFVLLRFYFTDRDLICDVNGDEKLDVSDFNVFKDDYIADRFI